MILAPLKYLAYKINSSKVFNKKIGYYNSLLAAETLINLKQRIRQPAFLEKKVDVDLYYIGSDKLYISIFEICLIYV